MRTSHGDRFVALYGRGVGAGWADPSGCVAAAAVAAAAGSEPPAGDPSREALLELMAARTQVRRFGVNVNRAVKQLNGTREPPEWLDRAVLVTTHAVERVDDAATSMARRTTRRRS